MSEKKNVVRLSGHDGSLHEIPFSLGCGFTKHEQTHRCWCGPKIEARPCENCKDHDVPVYVHHNVN